MAVFVAISGPYRQAALPVEKLRPSWRSVQRRRVMGLALLMIVFGTGDVACAISSYYLFELTTSWNVWLNTRIIAFSLGVMVGSIGSFRGWSRRVTVPMAGVAGVLATLHIGLLSRTEQVGSYLGPLELLLDPAIVGAVGALLGWLLFLPLRSPAPAEAKPRSREQDRSVVTRPALAQMRLQEPAADLPPLRWIDGQLVARSEPDLLPDVRVIDGSGA